MASELMAVSEQVAEPWVAMGYYCLSTKKATRAVYFAQKVCLPSVNFFIKHDANGAFVLTETRPIKMDYIVEVFILHRDPSAIVYCSHTSGLCLGLGLGLYYCERTVMNRTNYFLKILFM